jgi:DNA (cytosine-5)-methyltransferase 1
MVNQQSLNELALFAGAGGGILGGKLLGWRTVCAVEWEPYPASVLCARQNDGLLPPFPIWDDVQTFDGFAWRGLVDVVSGGFPCQDISAAGKGAGIDGERSGMWKHMARVVSEVRPRYVFVENSPMLVTRGLERVIGDLTALGYDTKWTVMGAADVGANHQRDRIWIVANANNARLERREQQPKVSNEKRNLADTSELFGNGGNDNARISMERETQSESGNDCGTENVAYSRELRHKHEADKVQTRWDTIELCSPILANTNITQCKRNQCTERGYAEYANSSSTSWWKVEPNVGRVADGVAARVDRLKAIGNGQVPLCAATAWRLLTA